MSDNVSRDSVKQYIVQLYRDHQWVSYSSPMPDEPGARAIERHCKQRERNACRVVVVELPIVEVLP